MISGEIHELKLLTDLEAISAQYQREFGAPPINLSLWDPAPIFIRDLELRLPPAPDLNGIFYAFSYELPERAALLERLGFDSATRGCLVTHSGSSAIVAAANWLRARGCSRVLILGPRYFTVPYTLTSLGIQWTIAYMARSDSGFSFPDIRNHVESGIDALWLTNPVYCTGVDHDLKQLEQFMSWALDRELHIVIDECLSEPGRRIAPAYSSRYISAIYAPHKSVCVNGVKFAAIVFDKSEQDHFDSWCDVWNGCLPISSILGVRHFLSSDFESYRATFRRLIFQQHKKIRNVAADAPSIVLDSKADGYLISAYVPHIEAVAGLDREFLKRAAYATGAIFISGARNELDPKSGLSFRLNLSAMDTPAIGAFARLCAWCDQLLVA
jgi:aspartate/methionine/tyrosine aminotransferase